MEQFAGERLQTFAPFLKLGGSCFDLEFFALVDQRINNVGLPSCFQFAAQERRAHPAIFPPRAPPSQSVRGPPASRRSSRHRDRRRGSSSGCAESASRSSRAHPAPARASLGGRVARRRTCVAHRSRPGRDFRIPPARKATHGCRRRFDPICGGDALGCAADHPFQHVATWTPRDSETRALPAAKSGNGSSLRAPVRKEIGTPSGSSQRRRTT